MPCPDKEQIQINIASAKNWHYSFIQQKTSKAYKRYQKHQLDSIYIISMSIHLPNSISFPFFIIPSCSGEVKPSLAPTHLPNRSVIGNFVLDQILSWRWFKTMKQGDCWTFPEKNAMQIWSIGAKSYRVIVFNGINKNSCESEANEH